MKVWCEMKNGFYITKLNIYLKLKNAIYRYSRTLNRFFEDSYTPVNYKYKTIESFLYNKNGCCILQHRDNKIYLKSHSFNHGLFELLRYHPDNDEALLKIINDYIKNYAFHARNERRKQRYWITAEIKDLCSIYKKCMAA